LSWRPNTLGIGHRSTRGSGMERRSSHHAILLQVHWPTELRMLGRMFGLTVESVA